MFVVLAILLSAAILGFMYHISQVNESGFRRKYELITELRDLVDFCRLHRAESHKVLAFNQKSEQQIEHIETSLLTISKQLIESASYENKSIYRILQTRIKKMLDEWRYISISQNQMVHGKTIRHCLFLIDEIVLTWLIEKHRSDLSDEYNLNWQQIIDTLEALTRFRIAIQDIGTEVGSSRLEGCAAILLRKVYQLEIIDPLATENTETNKVCEQLRRIASPGRVKFTDEQLYTISSDISLIVFNTYDQMLESITNTIYEPLPKLNPQRDL
ncbi:hypothetical protein L3Q72_04415 [Vibrio sp. JC009]|uniref:hypothetical protein n=1 Tax=Vibrio sp. JC009 TaxID=2912314 RepID=UPI0023B19A4C|nr:hypothetical protein [Vibrio sp. JC009]WED22649.1 hypothetical protein L3Q72_04415 [Vibrio sp. JC009]